MTCLCLCVYCAIGPVAVYRLGRAWFDEFAGNQLNTSLWTPIFSTNPTNNSLHAYCHHRLLSPVAIW